MASQLTRLQNNCQYWEAWEQSRFHFEANWLLQLGKNWGENLQARRLQQPSASLSCNTAAASCSLYTLSSLTLILISLPFWLPKQYAPQLTQRQRWPRQQRLCCFTSWFQPILLYPPISGSFSNLPSLCRQSLKFPAMSELDIHKKESREICNRTLSHKVTWGGLVRRGILDPGQFSMTPLHDNFQKITILHNASQEQQNCYTPQNSFHSLSYAR